MVARRAPRRAPVGVRHGAVRKAAVRFASALSATGRWLVSTWCGWLRRGASALRRVAAALRRRFARCPERVVATTAPHDAAGEGGGNKRRRVAQPDAEGPSAKVRGDPPSSVRRSGRQEDAEGFSALDGDLYGAAESCLGSNLDAPHSSSNAAPPAGILSSDSSRAQDSGEGAQLHAELVFEAALSPDAFVDPAATSSSLPAEGRILDDAFAASLGANHPAATSSSLPHGTPAGPAARAMGDLQILPSSAIAGDTARRAPPAGGANLDGADAVGALCYNAYSATPSANQAGWVEGLPPGAEGGGRCATPVAMEHGDGALAVGERLVRRAPSAKKGKKAASGAKKGTRIAKNAVPGGAASGGKKVNGASEVDSLEEGFGLGALFREELVVDEVAMKYAVYCWTRSKRLKKKNQELCDICYFKDGSVAPIKNEEMGQHIENLHKKESFPCVKKGCFVRCCSLGEAGLHNMYVHEQKSKDWWQHLLENQGVKLE